MLQKAEKHETVMTERTGDERNVSLCVLCIFVYLYIVHGTWFMYLCLFDVLCENVRSIEECSLPISCQQAATSQQRTEDQTYREYRMYTLYTKYV